MMKCWRPASSLNINLSRKKIKLSYLQVLWILCFPLTVVSQTPADTTRHQQQLKQVEIAAKSGGQQLLQSPQSVTVIDATKYYNRSAGAIDIIGQAAGIRVRQDGGLGSRAEFSINGISGKQLKFFLDGIPLDYFGAGAGLNILPVNIIDRIDIYKGVVPVELGADALGGAINIISRKNITDYTDVSYGYSSFNTHKGSLNFRRENKQHVFINVAGYYNAAANNYKVDVEIPMANGTTVPATVRRFHDHYTNYSGSVEVGISQKKWADVLSYSSIISGIQQDLQNNLVMSQPFGKVTYGERSWNNMLKYSKQQLLPGLDVNAMAGLNLTHTRFLDTSLNAYTWDGKIAARRAYGGETSGFAQDEKQRLRRGIGRINLTQHLDNNNVLNGNILGSWFRQQSDDPAAAAFPARMSKMTAGVAWSADVWEKQLTFITAAKYYAYSASGYIRQQGGDFIAAAEKQQQPGFSEALKWQINKRLIGKLSYEYASRLPDETEIFGDYALIKPNPSLIPETSHNLNAGVQWRSSKFVALVNGFYRQVDHIIYLKTSQFYSQYQNLLKAQVRGLEGDVAYTPVDFLNISANATYQDIINKSSAAGSGTVDDKYYNLRLPNTPYFFGNATIQFTKKDLFRKHTQWQCWYSMSYVNWFYLYWSVDGNAATKAVIPNQFLQHTGMNYSIQNGRFVVSAEVHNIADAKAYDNFSVQRPGRSFHIKIRTFLINH